MDRGKLVCTSFFVLILMFFSVNGAIHYGKPGTVVTRFTEHQMVTTASYAPHVPITISSNSDFSIQGWPGNGTSVNPYVIEGLNITADALCINITDTTVYFEVKDCMISSVGMSSYHGIVLDNVTQGTVQNCTINLHRHGIYLNDAINCTLTHNTAFSNDYVGVYLYLSDNCTLTHNTASSNIDTGFLLHNSNNCTLTHNTASSNSGYGFQVGISDNCTLTDNTASSNYYGFNIVSSDKCTLINNIVSNSDYYGFSLDSSDNCTLTHNTVSNNNDHGLYLRTGSEYNILYLNRLGNNGASDAQDNGTSNTWDDGISSGNYWMDYDGTGTYSIPGSAGSIDNYPFIWDIAIPLVDHPPDVDYIEGESGNLITWNPSDDHPESYTIYLDGTPIKSGMWNSSSELVIISVDGLSLGTHNYTLVVTDVGSNSVSDTVLVTVLAVTATITTTTTSSDTTDMLLIMVLFGGAIVAVVIMIAIILKKRKP